MKYFTKTAMSITRETFHSVAESLATRPHLKGGYDRIVGKFKGAGVGDVAKRSRQSVDEITNPKLRAFRDETIAIEKEYAEATKKPAMTKQQHDRLTKAKFAYDHKTKFYVDDGNARVLASFRKGPKDNGRGINVITVGESDWDPLLTDYTRRKLPKPKNFTNEFMG